MDTNNDYNLLSNISFSRLYHIKYVEFVLRMIFMDTTETWTTQFLTTSRAVKSCHDLIRLAHLTTKRFYSLPCMFEHSATAYVFWINSHLLSYLYILTELPWMHMHLSMTCKALTLLTLITIA